MVMVYAYRNCGTCREALKWLDAHGVAYRTKAIRETPPSPGELITALKLTGGDVRKLFNTSGADYRALGLKDKLPDLGEAECIRLLTENGNLVKRPLVIGGGIALAGFKPEAWQKALL